jgi:hypothetical protein
MKNFDAVRYIYPDAKFTMVNDDVSTIVWFDGEYPIPTAEQIQAAIVAMEAAEAQAAADKEAKKKAALDKLATLGLTADDIAALFN